MSTTIRCARDAYLAENGFTVEAYGDKWTDASFFGIRFKVPNTKRHAWALRLHDLHHVATGYGTDLVGEAEISVWELRRGVRPLGLYVAAIVATGAVMGLFLSPRRMLAAWRAAGDTNLFVLDPPYEDLLDFTVDELRTMLALPKNGVATGERRLHAYAPKARGDLASVRARS